MFKRTGVVKVMLLGAVLVGLAQADLVTTYKWQSLGVETIWDGSKTDNDNFGVTWMDFSGDGIITVGEDVTFTVNMYKEYAGLHKFDAARLWIEDDDGNLQLANTDPWIWNSSDWEASGTDSYVGKSKPFSFTTSFDKEGDFDFVARVTCNESLSQLTYDSYWNGWTWVEDKKNPSQNDWNAWKPNSGYTWQGEREQYTLHVEAQNVPEPTLLSLLGCGLLGLFLARRRKN